MTKDTASANVPRPASHAWRRVRSLLLGRRVRPILLLALLGFVIFGAFRAGLLLRRWNAIEDLHAPDVWRCFLMGLRFDAVPIGFALLPLTVALPLAPRWIFRNRLFRQAVTAYATTLVMVALSVEVIGAFFFMHFWERLNWMTVAHLPHFHEAALYIWNAYPVLTLVVGTVLMTLAARWGLGKLFWSYPVSSRLRLRQRIVIAVVLTGLAALAARGGVRHSLRQGDAYFCTNKVVSHLAMNNFFTLMHAAKVMVADVCDETEYYSFPPVPRAAEVASGMLLQPGETPLGGQANPLWRRHDTGIPRRDLNVVVILMESMAGKPVGAMGHTPSFTPELDTLCAEGVFLDRLYAVGPRTSRGIMGVLCGHPDVSGLSVLRRDQAQGHFLTLPAILHARGYNTVMIYGGDPNFDNMQGFLSKGGIERFIEERSMGDPRQVGNWGMPDEVIFDKAHQVFEELSGKGPFFALVLTVSNHEPFEIPKGRVETLPGESSEIKSLNAYRYADWALGEFFRKARSAEYFKNTLFVLVADHGRDFDNTRIVDVPGYRIPCLFLAPAILPPRRVDTVASQTDIAPTILALLGGSYEHCFLGRNILAVGEKEGFAIIHDENYLAFVRDDLALVAPPRHDAILYEVSGNSMKKPTQDVPDQEVQTLNLQMLSYYMMARHLFMTNAYGPPATAPASKH
jgi:phosphoglycerol transferase MdoB-like AlkP superfamily enzyme